jgi:hypothetical protein
MVPTSMARREICLNFCSVSLGIVPPIVVTKRVELVLPNQSGKRSIRINLRAIPQIVSSSSASDTDSRRCPLWVKSRHSAMSKPCPLFPPKADIPLQGPAFHKPKKFCEGSGFHKNFARGIQDFIKIALDQNDRRPLVEPPLS